MAYLIHAHYWPLSRAYAFVVGRRGGVPPTSDSSRKPSMLSFQEVEEGVDVGLVVGQDMEVMDAEDIGLMYGVLL